MGLRADDSCGSRIKGRTSVDCDSSYGVGSNLKSSGGSKSSANSGATQIERDTQDYDREQIIKKGLEAAPNTPER
jgi:hypothetical protein